METTGKTGIEAVIERIVAAHPICMPFTTAAGMLLFGTPNSAYVARARGLFPLRVSRHGSGLVCMTGDVIDFIQTGKSQTEKKSSGSGSGKGRPSRVEQSEAANRGLSVKELRAQQKLVGV